MRRSMERANDPVSAPQQELERLKQMMIVMKEEASEADVQAVVDRVESVGCSAHVSKGELLTVVGAIGDRDRVAGLGLEGAPGVDHLVPILKPYKLASSQFRKGERTVIDVEGRRVGGGHFTLIAGPCTVETRDQTLETARGRRRRRRDAPGRRLQAAHLAVLVPGPRRRGPALPAGGEGGNGPADRHRAHGRSRRARRGGGRRRHPDRRPQHAELHAAHRGRPHRHPGAAQARALGDPRGAPRWPPSTS